jgi:hypothetical protein
VDQRCQTRLPSVGQVRLVLTGWLKALQINFVILVPPLVFIVVNRPLPLVNEALA